MAIRSMSAMTAPPGRVMEIYGRRRRSHGPSLDVDLRGVQGDGALGLDDYRRGGLNGDAVGLCVQLYQVVRFLVEQPQLAALF